jgi:serine protease Do
MPLPNAAAALAASDALARELAAVADALRGVTVRVRTPGRGDGSGVVWRNDGLVVTNAHVARAQRAEVELPDGRQVEGRVVRRDPLRDLVALRLADATGLTAAVPGDVGALRPGHLVLALGYPFGAGHALALGVVHGVVRDAGAARWLRADIRLAPGNSGGPLADPTGRVLGLNTLVAGGLGYAIPAPVIERFLAARVGTRAA